MKETSLDVIKSIVEDLGGTSTAKTMVKVLKELKQALASGSSGGSSGGTSGGGIMVVNLTYENDTPAADKTYAEIMAQLDAGGDVLAKMLDDNDTLYARPGEHRVNAAGDGLIVFNFIESGGSILSLAIDNDDTVFIVDDDNDGPAPSA